MRFCNGSQFIIRFLWIALVFWQLHSRGRKPLASQLVATHIEMQIETNSRRLTSANILFAVIWTVALPFSRRLLQSKSRNCTRRCTLLLFPLQFISVQFLIFTLLDVEMNSLSQKTALNIFVLNFNYIWMCNLAKKAENIKPKDIMHFKTTLKFSIKAERILWVFLWIWNRPLFLSISLLSLLATLSIRSTQTLIHHSDLHEII